MTKLTRIWIVTKPTKLSTLSDICFSTDLKYLYLQFQGGLNPEDVHGFYDIQSRKQAETEAKRLLRKEKE